FMIVESLPRLANPRPKAHEHDNGQQVCDPSLFWRRLTAELLESFREPPPWTKRSESEHQNQVEESERLSVYQRSLAHGRAALPDRNQEGKQPDSGEGEPNRDLKVESQDESGPQDADQKKSGHNPACEAVLPAIGLRFIGVSAGR